MLNICIPDSLPAIFIGYIVTGRDIYKPNTEPCCESKEKENNELNRFKASAAAHTTNNKIIVFLLFVHYFWEGYLLP